MIVVKDYPDGERTIRWERKSRDMERPWALVHTYPRPSAYERGQWAASGLLWFLGDVRDFVWGFVCYPFRRD